MSNINDGGPAFPQGHPELCKVGQSVDKTQGMTLRDWFSGQALAGIMANPNLLTILAESNRDPALCAYETADLMLAERAKSDGN